MSARSVEEHASHISGLLTGLHTLSPTQFRRQKRWGA